MHDARLQLHWAAQIAAGVGRTLGAARPDDSHTSFSWTHAYCSLMQEPVGGSAAGLRLRDLTLVIARGGKLISELSLRGRTFDNGFAFLEGHFGKALKRPEVDLPDHPVAHGAKFDANPIDLAELAQHYAVAASLCEEVRASEPRAGAVRCWPHHFDLATLIALGGERTIGVGFSPGDNWYDEPYYYVTPWPYPSDPSALPMLSCGQWHTKGWVGAVLKPGRPDQQLLVRAFIGEARSLLA